MWRTECIYIYGMLTYHNITTFFSYVGINASDINYTAGRYDSSIKPPFDVGFEVC